MIYPEWYKNPEMLGHKWAIENLKMAYDIYKKYAKTKKQKDLYNSVIDLKNDNWHYWLNDCHKKYLSQVRYTLRHLDKLKPFDLYNHISLNHSMLKSDLLRYLELYSYSYDRERFTNDYCLNYGFYGMNKQDALNRCDNYINGLKEKYNYPV